VSYFRIQKGLAFFRKHYCYKMEELEPRGPQAALLRQRKFELLHRFAIPPDLLPGTLTRSFTRCGNPRCNCARHKGHEARTLTSW